MPGLEPPSSRASKRRLGDYLKDVGLGSAQDEPESVALIFGSRRSLGDFALLEVTFEALRV